MTFRCKKTLMEVSAEINGPYDDHILVKIGKERGGMLPHDVSVS